LDEHIWKSLAMSDDLDFEMEVVETESVTDPNSGADRKSSSTEEKVEAAEMKNPSAKLWPSIPEEWEMVRGNEVYDANPTYYDADGEVDYIEMDALKTDLSDPKYVGRRDPSGYSGQMFAEGDTLFAQITPCTENGKAALVPELRTEIGIGSTEFIVLSPDETQVLPRYLYYLSKSHPVHEYAVSRMRGSTGRQRVPVDVFRKELQIPLPSLPEQRRIASVLYAVDQAIQKTEAIIEQAKRVKRGLMQDLFRIGLVADRQLKDSRVGEIPNSWSVSILEKIVDFKNGLNFSADQKGSGTPIVNVPNLYDSTTISPTELERIEIEASEVDKYALEPGDIVMVRSSVDAEGVGQAALFGGHAEPVVFAGFTIRQRPDPGSVNPRYLVQYLRDPEVRKKVASLAGTTALTNLSQKEIGKLPIPLPPLDEQERIADLLATWDERVKTNEDEKIMLQRLKKGLMQDLLTGEVCTADKAIEVLGEVAAHG
jgi:type I restriction enzyme S subunit